MARTMTEAQRTALAKANAARAAAKAAKTAPAPASGGSCTSTSDVITPGRSWPCSSPQGHPGPHYHPQAGSWE